MVSDTLVTIYKDVFSQEAHHIKLAAVLERIKNGKSKELLDVIKYAPDKERQNKLKEKLPSICFSGVIPKGPREDVRIEKHSGLAILDFDNLTPEQYAEKKRIFIGRPYTVAAFLSPRGNGLKVLIRIKSSDKHRLHYAAIMKEFPDADAKNINPSRVCYESYDPEIYINYDAPEAYDKILEEKQVVVYRATGIEKSSREKFKNICQWMQKRNEHFVSGSRNDYIFKLASACCRFGIGQNEVEELIHETHLSQDGSFKVTEMKSAVTSAYKRNAFNSAEFSEGELRDIQTHQVVSVIEDNEFVKDVIYGGEVIDDALNILFNGYESAESTGIDQIDNIFKWKRGELTILTGIGNHGKSTMLSFLMANKSVKDGTKWGIFSPENYPPHEFYHDLTEMMIGAGCNPTTQNRPPENIYRSTYEFVSNHFFYVYPKDLAPTPEYIKSRFLELIIKHGVSGVILDPYNQMTNDYSSVGGRDDKYLESFLADCSRFAMNNNVFFVIVAHPHKLRKNEKGGYDCPDVFDLAGGAMWNNKADNILVYHRPNRHSDPNDPTCELHSKKIRRQKIVGNIGTEIFEYSRGRRRFIFEDYPLKYFLDKHALRSGEPSHAGNYVDYSQSRKEEDYSDDSTPF